MAGRARYGYLLVDVDVGRWYDNVARGSRVTADVYLRRLGSFCEHFNVSPKQLIAMGEGDLYNMLLDYVSFLEGNGCAGSYIESALKAVKSRLSQMESRLRGRLRLGAPATLRRSVMSASQQSRSSGGYSSLLIRRLGLHAY